MDSSEITMFALLFGALIFIVTFAFGDDDDLV